MHAERDLRYESIAGFQRKGVANPVDGTVTFDLLDSNYQIHHVILHQRSQQYPLLGVMPMMPQKA